MHKLLDYVCDEMEELEKKAEKGKLSMTEIQYADMLAHLKKNILTADAMMDADEYSNDGGNSYARGRGRYAKRDSMGRYSSEGPYRGGSYDGYRGYDGNRGGSYEGSYRGGNSNMNYSRAEAKDDMMMMLKDMEQNAHDEQARQMVKRWMKQAEEL